MKKCLYIFAAVLGVMMISNASAQLPSNPWVAQPPSPNDGVFSNPAPAANPSQAVTAPQYNKGPTDGEVLPVDPWSLARDRSGVKTWRQSGNHGRLNYVGEATTYTTAQGQEMIAPEVNRHNMLVMVDHLRRLGYKIPTSYDSEIVNAPKNYAQKLKDSYDGVANSTDPFSKSTLEMIRIFDDYTGLDTQNLMFNSLELMGTD